MHEIFSHRAKEFPEGVNPVDKALYLQLKCRIYRQQSGGTLDSIANLGVNVSNQIGAPLMALKQVVSKYEKNSVVANLLWDDNRREEQIAALFLFEDNLPQNRVVQILEHCVNSEVAEYAGSQWIANRSDANELLEMAFLSESPMVQVAMIVASAKLLIMQERGIIQATPLAKEYIMRRYEDRYCELVASRYRFKYE